VTGRTPPSSISRPGWQTAPAATVLLTVTEQQLIAVASQGRDFIRGAVEHALNFEQDTDAAKATWMWLVTLGTLAWDVSGSAILLFTHRENRAARILTRSLVDYGVRLEFYGMDSAAALHDFNTSMGAMRRFLQPALNSLRTNPDWPMLEALFIGETPKRSGRTTKTMMSRIFEAVDPTRREQLLEYAYDREYGIGSALSHGNEGSIWDVFSDVTGAAKDHQWPSRGVHSMTLALDIAGGILWTVRGIAVISGQHDECERLSQEMQTIVSSLNTEQGENG
jgi:hypothetical protein